MALPLDPSVYHIVLAYKSHTHIPQVSHTGLGNCALNTAKVLTQNGFFAVPLPVRHLQDLSDYLAKNPTVTNVVISALWAADTGLAALCQAYPLCNFAVTCHSNAAFLQAEPGAITLFRKMINLEAEQMNFQAAANSEVFCTAVTKAYQRPCTWLPNLYALDTVADPAPPIWRGGPIRAMLPGAMREQKNVVTQALAALIMAVTLKTQTTLWVSTGRNDGGVATRLFNAVNNMVGGSPYLTVTGAPWMPLPEFVIFGGSMNIQFQCSNSESFNQCAADAVSRGVPVVCSEAITWSPSSWHAKCDDANDVARVAIGLLQNPSAGRDGMHALQNHNTAALAAWTRYITQNQIGVQSWPANGVPLRFQGRFAGSSYGRNHNRGVQTTGGF